MQIATGGYERSINAMYLRFQRCQFAVWVAVGATVSYW